MIPRLYSAAFDSIRQAEAWQSRGGREGFVARLRLAGLLAEALVVTDAQLLDGLAFLDLGPDGVRRVVGTDSVDPGLARVVVVARAETLGGSLAGLVDSGAARLRGFEFSSLADEALAGRVASSLQTQPARTFRRRVTEAGPSAAVASALMAAGLDAVRATLLQRRWDAWLEAEANGRIVLERYRAAPFATAFDELPAEVLASSVSPRAVELARQGPSLNRSDFRALVRNELTGTDAELLRAWYDAAYHLGAAAQHRARHVSLLERGTHPGRTAETASDAMVRLRTHRSRPREVALPPEVLVGLGQMPEEVFNRARYETRSAVADWLAGDAKAMRRIAYVLEQATAEPNPRSVWRQTLGLFLVALGAFMAAVLPTIANVGSGAAAVAGAVSALLGLVSSALPAVSVLRGTRGRRLAGVVDVADVVS